MSTETLSMYVWDPEYNSITLYNDKGQEAAWINDGTRAHLVTLDDDGYLKPFQLPGLDGVFLETKIQVGDDIWTVYIPADSVHGEPDPSGPGLTNAQWDAIPAAKKKKITVKKSTDPATPTGNTPLFSASSSSGSTTITAIVAGLLGLGAMLFFNSNKPKR